MSCLLLLSISTVTFLCNGMVRLPEQFMGFKHAERSARIRSDVNDGTLSSFQTFQGGFRKQIDILIGMLGVRM